MPAASEPRLPRTWRPLGVRMAGLVFGLGLLVVCIVAWWSFDAEVRARFTTFQRGTLVFLGLLIYGAGYALARSRVVATPERLVVVNGYRRREYTWPEVLAVHMPPGAPWAVLDLADGTSQPAMGIQGSDGPRARIAVRELRELIDRQPG
ncbi:PH domain-containing protein [Nocardioides coralli]|uniref:PH domain-containing protein n=1 Tax=Nocardioides coralli TaxID=2872154 RepID=UPI001CA3C84E|nr:PH domain-containing protein [Nocardioides coralli]QZY30541.1 PH domain-containing protein [Nocardioides coralli]